MDLSPLLTDAKKVEKMMNEFNEQQKQLDSAKGTKFDTGKPRMDLISPFALEELGKVLEYGSRKYTDRNWEKGLNFSRIIGALLRHLNAYQRGEHLDSETGLSHLSAVLCNAHFLVHFEKVMPEMNDLPSYNTVKATKE